MRKMEFRGKRSNEQLLTGTLEVKRRAAATQPEHVCVKPLMTREIGGELHGSRFCVA